MQHRTRKIIVLLSIAITLSAIAFAVHLSLDPANYFFRNPADRAKWVYHPGSVAFVCSIMLIEALVACFALVATRPRALWVRCLLAFALLGPWAFVSSLIVVHMPAFVLFHHLWVWSIVALLFFTAVWARFRRVPGELTPQVQHTE